MKRTVKRIGSLLLTVCMVFTLLPVVARAADQSVNISEYDNDSVAINNAIQSAITAAGESGGGTVTITGTATLDGGINLLIDEGVTVDCQAEATGTSSSAMITIDAGRAGAFTVSGGSITTTGTGSAIYNNSAGTVSVSGGSITTSSANYAIHNASTGTVSVSGGSITNNKTNPGTAIWNASTGTVSVSGGTVSGNYYTIENSSTGAVSISGGTVSSASNPGYAISNSTGTVSVSGGTVSARNYAIFNISNGAVSVSGGTVSSVSGTAISNSSTGAVTLSGGTIKGGISGAAPTSNGTTPVYLATLTGLPNSAAVTSLTSPPGYGTKDVTTDADGKLYFYLPEGATNISMTANSSAYTGTETVVTDGTTTIAMSTGTPLPIGIIGFAAMPNVNAGAAGSAAYANAAAVIAALPSSVTATHASGSVSWPVTTWADTDTYDPTAAGSYTFTATLGTAPAGYTNSGGHTATVEAVVSAPGGGTMDIGGETGKDLSSDQSGTGWTWTASSAILTLTGDITGDIKFDGTGDITIAVNGTHSVTGRIICNAGLLTINGGGTLNVNSGDAMYPNSAIRAYKGLTIDSITVNATTTATNSYCIFVDEGSFTMSSGTLNADGLNSGILTLCGNISISGNANVTASGMSFAILAEGGNITIGGSAVVTGNSGSNGTGIYAEDGIIINGGVVTAKGQGIILGITNHGAIGGGLNGITVTGGTLTVGDASADPANGNVHCDLNVSGVDAAVTVNGNIANNGNLTVSNGNVTITGTVSGTTSHTGGTLNGSAPPITYAATLNININGVPSDLLYDTSDVLTLKLSTNESQTVIMTHPTAGTWTADVQNGKWDLYVNSEKSSATFTVNNAAANVTLDYFTVTTGINLQDTATGGTILVNGISESNLACLKGETLTFTATGTGADSYSYAWSGTHGETAISGTGNTYTISSVTGPTNLICTITGSGGGETDGDSGGSSGGSTVTPPVDVSGSTASATVTSTAGADGKAAASVPAAQVDNALKQAQDGAVKSGEAPRVEIKVEAPADATAVETSVPQAAMTAIAGGNLQDMTISSPVASLTFDGAALNTIAGAAAGDVKFSASKVDTADLPAAVQAFLGNRPVYEFSVTSGGNTISRFGGNVTVAVPYQLRAGEDPNAVIISFINDSGNLETVTNGRYDPKTGTVIFTTDHFSQYAVGYSKVSFSDVADTAWYSDAVSFIAARKITTGTGAGKYSPEATLTRGEFIVLMMRAYNISPDTNPSDSFADAGDTYYTSYLAAAKRLGISAGVGNNMFAPDKAVSRQEMFTLLYNALKVLDKLPDGASGKTLSDFTDASYVASWASEAIAFLVENGTVSGSGGTLSPTATTTRAQMAQVLYNLITK